MKNYKSYFFITKIQYVNKFYLNEFVFLFVLKKTYSAVGSITLSEKMVHLHKKTTGCSALLVVSRFT